MGRDGIAIFERPNFIKLFCKSATIWAGPPRESTALTTENTRKSYKQILCFSLSPVFENCVNFPLFTFIPTSTPSNFLLDAESTLTSDFQLGRHAIKQTDVRFKYTRQQYIRNKHISKRAQLNIIKKST